nr:hypothetical protein FVER53263_12235 [Fusarium verticillioides]
MKVSLSSWLAAACLFVTALVFPQIGAEQLKTYQEYTKRSPAACPYSEEKRDTGECPFAKERRAAKFEAKKQRISVSSKHEFLPPNLKAGDQRGLCLGLNALANHGYLPGNGVADMQTITKATKEVYGVSLDLGGFLAVYGTVFNGNPVSLNPGYSIGGPSRFSQKILNGSGLFGNPSGLSGSHNKYEPDISATRGDLYVTGNNYHVILERFEEYWSAIRENTPAPEQHSALASFHYQSFQESEKTNSHFFYSPFSRVLVSPATYSFHPRMIANHSDKYLEGYLWREIFTSFFGVKGSKPGNFKVNQGWERIPENWYRRPVEDEFSIPDFLVDVLEHAVKHPCLLNIGGNTGKLNSFSGVDIGDLTGGVFNTAMLLKGDNLECFVMQIIMAAAPDVLGSQFTDVTKALTPLADKLRQLLARKTCPKLQKGPLRGVIEGVGDILGELFTTGNKAESSR